LDDDKKLEKIRNSYSKGELLTGQVKQILIEVLCELVSRHQIARKSTTDDVIDAFMAIRKLRF